MNPTEMQITREMFAIQSEQKSDLLAALAAIIKEAGPAYAVTDDQPTGTISTIVHIARSALRQHNAAGIAQRARDDYGTEGERY